MSSRERWTVYPLLFLTLGIALTDKITRQVRTDSVICKQLIVTDRAMRTEVLVKSNAGGGVIRLQGEGKRPNVLLGQIESISGLILTDAQDKPIGVGLAVQNNIGRTPTEQTPPTTPSGDPVIEPDPPKQEAETAAPEAQPPSEQPSPPSDPQ